MGLMAADCQRTQAVVLKGDASLTERNGTLYRGAEPFSGSVVAFYANGKPESREDYVRGKQQGLSLLYYPSGILQWKRTFAHGVKEGLHEGWWENGRKKFEYSFREGLYQGDVKEWYANGVPALSMHYDKGVETGPQRAWRENGTLYANYEVRDGRQYGMLSERLCYSVKDGRGVFVAAKSQ